MRPLHDRCAVSLIVCASLALASCASNPAPLSHTPVVYELRDEARARRIPVAIYGAHRSPRPLVIISNGYGVPHTDYSFIAERLAQDGYLVASVRHDLPEDPPMPSGENLDERRRPWWEQGVSSLLFLAAQLRAERLATDDPLTLIGHSNGGDISMLFATLYPDHVHSVVSLDNRRMPLPRTAHPRVCSIRSSDQVADPGVLPPQAEQRALDMQITRIEGLSHNDMSDVAAAPFRERMLELVFHCLEEGEG